jgi:hypothetical protein
MFLKEGVHDVNWDQLICQNQQLPVHASKFVYVSQQCAIFAFHHAMKRMMGIHKAARSNVLQRPTKPQTRRACISVMDDELWREIA